MAQTITPVVHGGRRGRWVRTLGLHVVGATLSAAAFGAVLGGAGMILGAPWGLAGALAVAGVAVLYAARELAGLPVPLAELRRQVPEWWRSAFSPGTAGFLYGLGLGVGFATHLRHGTLVAVGAASLASGDPLLAAAAMAGFGLARSLALAVTWVATSREDAEAVTAALERLALRPGPRILNGAALVAIAAAATLGAGSAGPSPSSQVAAVVLTAVFGWAAVSKAIRVGAWRRALNGYGLPATLARLAVWAVPIAEASVSVAILAGAAVLGSGVGLILLLVFSIAVIRARRAHGDRLPCGCFGRYGSRSAGVLLARNAGLACLAVAVPASGDVAPRLPTIGAGDALPALLAATGAGLAGVLAVRTARLRRGARRSPLRASAAERRPRPPREPRPRTGGSPRR